MDKYLKANRDFWNEATPVHYGSDFYDVEGFKSGRSSLRSIELEELGDVAGKSLLHLQCHFGMDTLSWARLGAEVTGVDFSDRAIGMARSLSREIGVPAKFVQSDIYGLPDALKAEYDIVFTSYGVLVWLPDLTRWAEVISQFLKPGGTFCIVDAHPFAHVFYNDDDATDLRMEYPYSCQPSRPLDFGPGPTYTDGSPELLSGTYEWNHSMGNILNSLISAGLNIEFLHEFHFAGWQALPMMEQGEDGWWRLQEQRESMPFLFSLRATK